MHRSGTYHIPAILLGALIFVVADGYSGGPALDIFGIHQSVHVLDFPALRTISSTHGQLLMASDICADSRSTPFWWDNITYEGQVPTSLLNMAG